MESFYFCLYIDHKMRPLKYIPWRTTYLLGSSQFKHGYVNIFIYIHAYTYINTHYIERVGVVMYIYREKEGCFVNHAQFLFTTKLGKSLIRYSWENTLVIIHIFLLFVQAGLATLLVTFSSLSSFRKTIIILPSWHLQYTSLIHDLTTQQVYESEIFLKNKFKESTHLARKWT